MSINYEVTFSIITNSEYLNMFSDRSPDIYKWRSHFLPYSQCECLSQGAQAKNIKVILVNNMANDY